MVDTNYMVSALLRMLIKELSEPFLDEEKRQLYIIDFKNCFSETLSKLSEEEISEVKNYMDFLLQHTMDSKELLTVLSTGLSENSDDQEVSKRNDFVHHVLSDKQRDINDVIEIFDLTIFVTILGMEELNKYLPTSSSETERKLTNTKENIGE